MTYTTFCGAQFRDTFFTWFFLIIWIITLFVEVDISRYDLITYYGLFPAIIAAFASTAFRFAAIFVLPKKAMRYVLVGIAVWGAFVTVRGIRSFATIDYKGPVLARLWHDVSSVGPAALGVLIDYLSCCVIAFSHVAIEIYRRGFWDSHPGGGAEVNVGDGRGFESWCGRVWRKAMMAGGGNGALMLVTVFPLVFYPLFIAEFLPSGHDILSGSDCEPCEPTVSNSNSKVSKVRRLGPWPVVWFFAMSLASWFTWVPSTVDMYRRCGPRWRPQDFEKCGLNTTLASQYTVSCIMIFLAVGVFYNSPRFGFNNKSPSKFANNLHQIFIRILWGLLAFINVAAALAAGLAMNYVDQGDYDYSVVISNKKKSDKSHKSHKSEKSEKSEKSKSSRSRSSSRRR